MLKLKRLKIHKYRNVRPGAELSFNDGYNILLGRNGTGKTTLLNLVSNVLRLTFADLSREEISIEIDLSYPGCQISATLHVDAPEPVLHPSGDERFAKRKTPSANFRAATILQFEDEPRERNVEVRSGGGLRRRIGDQEVAHDIDPGELSLVHLILDASWGRFDHPITKSALGLQRLLRLDESLKLLEDRYSRSPLITLTAVAGHATAADNPALLPEEVGDALIDSFNRDPTVTEFAIGHEGSSALREVARILDLRGAQMRASLIEKDIRSPEMTEYSFGSPRFLFTRRDGSIFPLDHLSYGQKRLLAFYLYLGANPDIVIADELVNGLHHGWIEECVHAIGERQAFLTSQNPLLLDYLPFESVEQAKRTFVLCRLARVDDRDEMVWSNMTDEEAEMFFSAYRVGLQQVGEILKTRGLW